MVIENLVCERSGEDPHGRAREDAIIEAARDFIADRSVWREVVSLTGHGREELLTSVAWPRLERLTRVAEDRARP